MTDASPCCSRTVYPPVFGAQTLKVTLVAPEVVVVEEGVGGVTLFSPPGRYWRVGEHSDEHKVIKLPSYGNVLPNPKGQRHGAIESTVL